MPGKIIALVGPSGVGKNYAKQAIKKQFPLLLELTVYTTRPKRPSDGLDRKTDIATEDFLKMKKDSQLIATHQPFGTQGDWYGFSQKQIDEMLINNKIILTEIHPDNIPLFKKLYSDQVFIIALIAKNEYLKYNLKLRNSEKETDKTLRLNRAAQEIESIRKMQKEKLINSLLEINWNNRDKLSELVVNEVMQEIRPLIEQENKLKFK